VDLQQNTIEIRGLHFSFDGRPIFDGIDLDIPRGKITAIMGPSGTGKTTLLRLIGAQLYPNKGKVIIDGHDIHQMKAKQLFGFRKKMGLLFQSGALFTNLNVFENVAFPLREHTDLSEAMIRDLVLMKLQIVGLRGARALMPNEISGGMARRVALARAMALDPQLMMYDEPFTGLDPISRGVIVKLVKELNDALNITTIVVSHDVEEVTSIADYIYLISNGNVIDAGSPAALKSSETPAVKQFMHGMADGVVPFHYPAKDYKEDLFND